jgi:hypothetical protein
MRDIETIDAELRLVARAWRVARHMSGCTPSTALIDQLLDERAASSAVADAATSDASAVADAATSDASAQIRTLPRADRVGVRLARRQQPPCCGQP